MTQSLPSMPFPALPLPPQRTHYGAFFKKLPYLGHRGQNAEPYPAHRVAYGEPKMEYL